MLLSLLAVTTVLSANTTLSWHNDKLANEFWVLDHVADWQTGEGNAYRKLFDERFKLDDRQRQALKAYVNVRQAHAKDERPPPDVKDTIQSIFPPQPRAEERFAIPFLNAADEGAACVAAGLDPAELKVVVTAFNALREPIDQLLEDGDYLPAAMKKLEDAGARAKADAFIESMKSFYGITDDAPYRVHVLWAPRGFGQSTVWGHEVILTLTRKTTENDKDLISYWGVLVHELGHAFLSQMADDEKATVARRIVDGGGLLNQRHHNIIDEATQTALGNIVFMRDHLPDAFERLSFYDYEPKNLVPDAIDSLGRELEAAVPAALAQPHGFSKVFVGKALEAQRKLFGNTPLYHSHVALALTGTKAGSKYFEGLFWGVSRFNYDEATADNFAKASHENEGISRWVLLTQAQATPAFFKQLDVPERARVQLGAFDACAHMTRRKAESGYDTVVVARDDDSMRKVLISLRYATATPEAKPLCVKASAH